MFLYAKKGVKIYHEYYIDTDIKSPSLPQVAKIPTGAVGAVKWEKTIGDRIEKYEIIATLTDGITIYSPYNGYFSNIEISPKLGDVSGIQYAVIETAEDKTPAFPLWEDFDVLDKKTLIEIVKKAAITDELRKQFLYYTIKCKKKFDKIIIDCVDDEPYSFSKTATVLNFKKEVFEGAKLIGKALDIKDIELLICKNLKTYSFIKEKNDGIKKVVVKGKYPKLPVIQKYSVSTNAIRLGAQTCRAVYRAIFYREADLNRLVTVWGEGIKNPAIAEIPVGVQVEDILKEYQAFGMIEKAVSGGTMTGYISSLKFPLHRFDEALTVMPFKKHHKSKECINCGRCAIVCPSGLAPYYMIRNSNLKGTKHIKQLCTGMCSFCGACSYICPSRIPLTEIIKTYNREVK